MTISTKKQYQRALVRRDKLEEAWEKALAAQSYTIGSEQVNHTQFSELDKKLNELEDDIAAYEAIGTNKRIIRRIVPRD